MIDYWMCFCAQMNKIGVTEHIEADECKFALWEGTVAPISDYKLILRVSLRCSEILHSTLVDLILLNYHSHQ